MKKSLYLSIVVFVVFLMLSACSGGAPAAASQATPTVMEPVASDTTIIAEGRVVPAQDTELSFATSGVISEILIKEGDKVEAGQVLARLVGNEQAEASISAAKLEILMAEQDMAALEENADMLRAQALLDVAAARKELDKAEKRMVSKEYQRGSQEQVEIARANYVMAERAVKDAESVYNMFTDAPEDDVNRASAFANMAAARQNRDKALANMNYLMAKPNELDVAEVEGQLAVAQAKLKEAETRLEKLKDGPQADQVELVQAKISNAQTKVAAAQASLKDLELRAPFAGVVDTIQVTAGQFVQPGLSVTRLSDQSAWLVETTDLTELNVARITPGMGAFIKFDALPDVELIGRVQYVENYGENRQGDIVYTVVLKLDEPDPRLRWNMTAMVTFEEQ